MIPYSTPVVDYVRLKKMSTLFLTLAVVILSTRTVESFELILR